jgi:hypothetical protein
VRGHAGQLLCWLLTPYSTTANGDDDFDFVTVRERMRVKRAARHDLAIAFNGDAFARKAERRYQSGAGERRFELAGVAIYGYGYHGGRELLGESKRVNPSFYRVCAGMGKPPPRPPESAGLQSFVGAFGEFG